MQQDWEKKLAIVILNYNGADMTIKCLTKIRNISEYIHIVVVDNCSTNNSADVLSKEIEGKKNVYFIKNEKNTGYAAGNNVGLRYISEKINDVDTVCIMNPDIIINDIDDYRKLYDNLWKDNSLAVITGQTLYNGKLRQPNDFGWKELTPKHLMFSGTLLGKVIKTNMRYETLIVNENKLAYIDIVQGCFFMAKKDVLAKINYFDEGTFLYEEEAILSKKVKAAGYKEAVLIDVFVNHNHQEKEKSLIKKSNKLFDMKCFYYSRKYYIKHFSGLNEKFIRRACVFLDIDFGIKRIIKGL